MTVWEGGKAGVEGAVEVGEAECWGRKAKRARVARRWAGEGEQRDLLK